MGTNVKQELSFDGFGVNGSDEHKTRIARFLKTDEAMVYGPLFAAAPELLEALEFALVEYEEYFIPTGKTKDDVVITKLRAAINKAKGQ